MRPLVTGMMAMMAMMAMAMALSLLAAAPAPPAAPKQASAVFAGGCFWCMETAFEGVPGVLSATSGYSGGTKANPTYDESNTGTTGHAESVEVVYDPAKISYEKLLDIFIHNIDPTVSDRQFCDVGTQYRSAIFVKGAAERKAAETALAEAQKKLGVPVKTQVVEAGPFYRAEEYHQDYYLKNPVHYRAYRAGCGRDARLKELWGKDAAPH